MRLSWGEWDGHGGGDIVAWTLGWSHDHDEARLRIRQLGVEFPRDHRLFLHHGYIGYVGGDIIPTMCADDGYCLDVESGVTQEVVDSGTVTAATFAIFLPDE